MSTIDSLLEAKLRSAEPEVADEGFSESVMLRLPAKQTSKAKARRWTLGAAAVAGSIATSILGAPLETAFSSLVLGTNYDATMITVLTLTVLAVPVAWVFYSK